MKNEGLRKAMILAAGFGTRLRPLTDNTPKALVEYEGEPMIRRVIRKLESGGIEEIVINTHHHADKMKEYFSLNSFDAKITLIHESEILGTGGAIKNAKKELAGADYFLIYNADVDSDMSIAEMMQYHIKHKSMATLAVMNRETKRPLIVGDHDRIIGRTADGKELIYSQKYEHSKRAAFSGIHIISSEIFELFPSKDNFDIVLFYMDAISRGKSIGAFDISGYSWKDLGTDVNILQS